MKILILIISTFTLTISTAFSQTVLELEPIQSMCITGKGPGQDGAINPYLGKDSISVIENIGKNDFSIRIQKAGKIIKTFSIKPKETRNVLLRKGDELYFDTEKSAVAKVDFKEAQF
ncbi:hypothetical protein ACFQ1Q_12735 [Winogradskyella litorisediminis]|uniref:Uncharacterized protein n=1 Tax=Winogradskyella litorisediminis TaxID=1156618 RepID=A0ABW3NBV8_9FLAO